MYTLIIHLYALCVGLLAPFHKKAKLMRLGQWKTNRILREKIDRDARYIWFHAASLGEFEQGRPMMEKIKKEYPHYKILLTFFSPSGYEVRKNYEGADVICYLPFDTPYRVKKFLDIVNPERVIFIKYDFWANYLSALDKRNIPAFVVSAIFRKDQFYFQWYGKPFRKVLSYFRYLFVQDEISAQLLAGIGLRNVTVCGDTRFDRVLEIQEAAKPIPPVKLFSENKKAGEFILVAGSSWPEDEELFIPYFNEHPEMKLIIAPHEIHESHLSSIESLLKRPSVRLSQVNECDLTDKSCLIVDSFGLLSSIYRYGDMAYIGGGFGAGIHNTLEAAVYGIPVLFGPKFHKFKEAKGLLRAGGGFSFSDKEGFESIMQELTIYPELLISSGKIAGDFVKGNAGATDRILSCLDI
ncbi:MAG: 3-deoxy-D-manno-octulosonic acid transferase [Tannerellaceae bacterium]|nr:3-deoxy-D-manno-octulosonic acid transferase [Tannerellaceae bacterium]